MALDPADNELFGPETEQLQTLRAAPYEDGLQVKKLAAIAGAPTLARLTPLAYDAATQTWKVWSSTPDAAVNEVQTYDLGGPTAGTYTLTLDGEETGNIDFDAIASSVETAFEALSNVGAGNGTVSGGPSDSAPIVITFTGALAGTNQPTIEIDGSGLTGGSPPSVATVTTPGSPAGQADKIAGFVFPDEHDASASNETQLQVMVRGVVHRDDVVLPSGEQQADLDEALKEGPREKGFVIQGLPGVH